MRFRMMLAGLLMAGLSACAGMPRAEYAAMTPLPQDAHPAPVSFSILKYSLPTGADAGRVGAGWCLWQAPVGRGDLRGTIDKDDIKDAFHDALAAEGYDVTGAPDLIFPEEVENDALRAEYRAAAEIIDARTDVCYSDDRSLAALFPGRGGFTGQLYLKIRWSVYDALHRTSVYKTQTEGYARRSVPNPEGMSLLMTDAFAMAAHNFGADATLQDLLVHGARPPADMNGPKMPLRPRRFDPSAPLVLPAMALSKTPFTDHIDDKRRVAVLVQGGSAGHGSGFFISRDGDILTDAHVVGDALHVRVKLSDRGAGLVAEVVRVDRARDVALIRLMDPPGFTPTILPLRPDWPKVGEKVYAIGAPQDTNLQDSVTSGIVSAWRKAFKIMGVRQDFIQSDVTVQPGSSGGPMLDAQGNIVGLTDMATMNGDASEGLNYFTPIASAMQALGISVTR